MGLFAGLFPAAEGSKSTLFSSDSVFRRPASNIDDTSTRKRSAAPALAEPERDTEQQVGRSFITCASTANGVAKSHFLASTSGTKLSEWFNRVMMCDVPPSSTCRQSRRQEKRHQQLQQ